MADTKRQRENRGKNKDEQRLEEAIDAELEETDADDARRAERDDDQAEQELANDV